MKFTNRRYLTPFHFWRHIWTAKIIQDLIEADPKPNRSPLEAVWKPTRNRIELDKIPSEPKIWISEFFLL